MNIIYAHMIALIFLSSPPNFISQRFLDHVKPSRNLYSPLPKVHFTFFKYFLDPKKFWDILPYYLDLTFSVFFKLESLEELAIPCLVS